jgi:hypothetical protein
MIAHSLLNLSSLCYVENSWWVVVKQQNFFLMLFGGIAYGF